MAVACLTLLALATRIPPANTAPAVANVSGDVSLVPSDNNRRAKDASHVIVWLSPLDHARHAEAAIRKLQHFRMVQQNKRFEPGLLVVPVGSIVDFPNLDPWFHNVFSLYRGKRFDLGLYQAGSQKSIRFDRPGPSYLFCNIHPEMTGVILAVDSEFFAASDKAGHYSIAGVPAGRYMLHVWYESASADALEALERLVVLDGSSQALASMSIPVTKSLHAEHKNKYGESYDSDALKPEY